jgi:hypothetical protein
MVQRVQRQPAQGRADGEAPLVDIPRQEAGVQQLRAQPVRGGLGQAQALRQIGQRERAVLAGQQASRRSERSDADALASLRFGRSSSGKPWCARLPVRGSV